jgi:hypothetical protein
MFGSVEKNKQNLKIQEYSISQTSLEQIFNQFASQQEEEQGDLNGFREQADAAATGSSAPASSVLTAGGGGYRMAADEETSPGASV